MDRAQRTPCPCVIFIENKKETKAVFLFLFSNNVRFCLVLQWTDKILYVHVNLVERKVSTITRLIHLRLSTCRMLPPSSCASKRRNLYIWQ